MSWQNALACWVLRRQFRPETLRTTISVERARAQTAKRVWSPRVPRGWALHERYGPGDVPLRGEWLEPIEPIESVSPPEPLAPSTHAPSPPTPHLHDAPSHSSPPPSPRPP